MSQILGLREPIKIKTYLKFEGEKAGLTKAENTDMGYEDFNQFVTQCKLRNSYSKPKYRVTKGHVLTRTHYEAERDLPAFDTVMVFSRGRLA